MARSQEEPSTNQVGHRRLALRESPTASSLVAAMPIEELRSFCQVLADISLKLLDGSTVSIVGWENNSVYFTWEQFTTGLRFPISLLVKQFLHFTRAPLALIHPKVFRILMGCSVLNSLYQLDISLVEIGDHLYMSVHSPRL